MVLKAQSEGEVQIVRFGATWTSAIASAGEVSWFIPESGKCKQELVYESKSEQKVVGLCRDFILHPFVSVLQEFTDADDDRPLDHGDSVLVVVGSEIDG